MENYIEDLRELLRSEYAPTPGENRTPAYKSLSELYAAYMAVFPATPLDESDLYDLLKQEGFKIKKIKIRKYDEEGGYWIEEVYAWELWKEKPPTALV